MCTRLMGHSVNTYISLITMLAAVFVFTIYKYHDLSIIFYIDFISSLLKVVPAS